ncbi:MAG: signal recognition particle-docking protein FtsY, partial [Pseudohongiella sp.]
MSTSPMFGFIKKRKDKDKDSANPAIEADTTPEAGASAAAPAVEQTPQTETPVSPVAPPPEASPPVAAPSVAAPPAANPPAANAPAEKEASGGFFSRLRQGLSRTRGNLAEGLGSLLGGRKIIDAELLDDIEMQLLTADVGIEATDQVIAALTAKVKRKQLNDGDALMAQLQSELRELLAPCTAPLDIPRETRPYVILVVGVNGVGKTTTIGKLARRFQLENRKVMLAAGDTFRAAAVEQLQTWGERNQVPVIAQASGSDSASVIFDAYQAAKARGIDVLIADTAGRLHNKANLMQELEKIVRVLKKQDDQLPHEVMLVLDATTGQNALSQAKSFNDSVKLTGLCLTKLDGTAKGGMVFAIANAMKLP